MKQGIKDSPEFWQRQIMETGEFQSDPVLVNTLVNNAQATLHWLREIGIPFDDQVFEAWGGKFQRAHSAGQKRSGMTYVRVMNHKARSLGVKVRLRTEAVSLIEKDSQVIGVKVKDRNGKLTDLEAKDVVIATGGFTANVPLRLKYDSRLDATLFTTANQTGRGFDGSTGDGILMAEKLGAQTVDMDAIQLIPLRGGRLLNYVGGDIFVDSQGKRFVDESKGVKAIGEAYLNLPDRVFWVISDSQSQKSLDLVPNFLRVQFAWQTQSLKCLRKCMSAQRSFKKRWIVITDSQNMAKTKISARRYLRRKLINRLFISGASSLIFITAAAV